jgi:hypothetical protein
VGTAGVVVEPRVEELLRACRSLHDDQATWEERASCAHASRRRQPDTDAFFDRLEAIYEEASGA